NCPVGLRRAFHNASRLAASLLSAAFTLGPALAAAAPQQKQSAPLTQIKPAPSLLLLIVLDATGVVVPSAKVVLTNESSGAVLSAKRNDRGELRLSGLPSAKYRVAISTLGFRTFTAEAVPLPVKTPPKYTLEIAAMMGQVVIVDPVEKFFSPGGHTP